MEFALIARIRRRAAARDDVLVGIGDDGAVVRVPSDCDLVVVADTVNVGVHFPDTTAPFDIGWKALAVNLSDLAAMGAAPAWCTMSLSMPEASEAWLDAYLDGFLGLAAQHGCALIGGDTTRGPLSVAVTAHGLVPPGRALRRTGARAGDDIWITGSLGDAAGALSQWRSNVAIDAALRARLDRPTPRIDAGLALRDLASSCIDVSDGLLADLSHMLRASEVGATVEAASLPISPALQSAFDPRIARDLQLNGGDDYELCFTAPPSHRETIDETLARVDVPATVIGRIESSTGLRVLDESGAPWTSRRAGWDHFAGGHP